ncbi:MAG: polysaccharide biosynthesis/export family protein [Croceibacterium sp.]
MKLSCRRMVAAVAVGTGLSACQPPLKSQLPVGQAAYQSINATVQPVALSGPYLLRAGDRISVNVYQEPELTMTDLPIDETGTISLPLVGVIHAAGRSVDDISGEVQRSYAKRFLRNPQVSIMLRQASVRTLSVEGQVAKPGQFAIEPGNNTLLSAVAMAGSPSNDAKLNEVLLFRTINGERVGGRFDLTAIRAGRMADPQVLPGDVIVVGFSSLRGAYRDILQAAPIVGLFTRF